MASCCSFLRAEILSAIFLRFGEGDDLEMTVDKEAQVNKIRGYVNNLKSQEKTGKTYVECGTPCD